MNPSTIEIAGTVIFTIAVLHTFVANFFTKMAHKYPEGSIGENLFHYLGEVEVVFGMWGAIFICFYVVHSGLTNLDAHHHLIMGVDAARPYLNSDGTFVSGAVNYLSGLNYTEPAFVFVIMCMAGTRPIILLAEKMIMAFSKIIPLPKKMAFYISALILGPLLGSFITEPAAMTVTALILLDYFFSNGGSQKFKYMTLGLLFVNVSVGGTLSHFAAPPVLMVAGKWHWGLGHMITNFGFKAAIAVAFCTIVVAFLFKNELQDELQVKAKHEAYMAPTWWMTLAHLIFMGLVVYTSHHMVFFLGLFLFFLGFMNVTQEYQDAPKLTESLMVGFFLGGLVTLGTMQAWWIQVVLSSLGEIPLFSGATALTAITDNAALTYLGSLVEGLSDSKKYFLVAGAVTGGGLTVIANAPNPAGFGILKASFGEEGISPLKLFLGALFPTVVAFLCFLFIPSL